MFLQALLRAPVSRPASFARATARSAAPATVDDAIRQTLLQRLERAPWWDGRTANVFVDAGVVVYQGWRNADNDRAAARQLALATPGVQGVWDARVPRRKWQSLG